jgi:hypothetical protein
MGAILISAPLLPAIYSGVVSEAPQSSCKL